MPSDTQERLTPGQTFVDAAGQRRWKSRVPGMPNVEADAFEEEVQDTLLSAAPPSFTLEDLPATRLPSPEALTALRGLYARTGRALPETLRPTELETARAEDPFAGATPKFTLEPVSEASPARSLAQALPTAPTTADLSIEERVARALSGEAPAEAETASPLESVPLTEQQLALARARYAGRDIRGSIAPPKAQETPSAAVTTPVPFAQASPVSDQAGVKTGALPATTSSTPAPPADTAAKAGLPAPETGAGGDVSERDLYLARLAAQSAAGFGAMGAGKSIDMGIADTLGERLKQVQALRAKREERAMELAREDEQSAALVDQYKSLAAQGLVPELPGLDRLPFKQAASLIKTYGSLPGLVQRAEKTKAEIPLVQARAGTEERKPEQKDTQLKETERHNRAMEAAAWAAANRAARGAAEERGIKPETLSNRLKDLNAQTKPFQEIVSSLKEADAALSALGTGQISRGAKIASKIPLVGESLVSTPELRAMQGQEGLKQSYQKLKTGLAAVGQELASFERQFGTDWQADPRKAPLAIETLKQITQDALRRTQAPFGAGTGNAALDQMEVLSLLKNTGGLTADNPIFAPNPKLAAAAGMAPPSATPAEGKVRMISPDGRPAKIPAAEVGARKAQGWKEAP